MPTDRVNNLASPTGASCPALMDLAAYLDGRAPEQQADAIELHLVACNACLETVREYRQMREEGGESLVLALSRVIEQAMALVPAKAMPQWWIATRRAAAIAAMLAVCAVGYQVGAAIAAPSSASSSEDAGLFFGLLEDDELESVDDLLFAAEGKVS